MAIPELETPFSKNWNGKLWCDHLTTIRLLNPAKYKVGSIHWLTLKGVRVMRAQVVIHEATTTEKLDDRTALLDAGMLAKDLCVMMRKMYKRPDGALLSLSLVTFKVIDRVKKEATAAEVVPESVPFNKTASSLSYNDGTKTIVFEDGDKFAFHGGNEVFTFKRAMIGDKQESNFIECEDFKGNVKKFPASNVALMVKL